MVHLVGLGGGGCNVVEFAISHGFEAVYTLVSSPKRECHSKDAEFIEFKSPQFYFANPLWFKDSIVMPEQLRQNLLKHKHNLIICCAGSYTGTMLLKSILEYDWSEDINFSYFVGTPFKFERGNKKIIINYLKTKYKGFSIKYISLEQIVKTEGQAILVEKAFQMADHLMFSRIAPNSEPCYKPYITPFINQAVDNSKNSFESEIYQLLRKRKYHYNKQFRFTSQNLKKFEYLNILLCEKGKEAFKQAGKIEKHLLEQMKVGKFVSDYEIEFRISLWAEKKYSNIEELNGNSFFEYEPSIHYNKKGTPLKEVKYNNHFLFVENFNEYPKKFQNQHHCYLLHDLYDHTWLSWQDIADVEEVWIEVVVRIQHFSTSLNP